MSDHTPRETEVRQTFLGLRPYVLIELHDHDDARLTLAGGSARQYLSMMRRAMREVRRQDRRMRRERRQVAREARRAS